MDDGEQIEQVGWLASQVMPSLLPGSFDSPNNEPDSSRRERLLATSDYSDSSENEKVSNVSIYDPVDSLMSKFQADIASSPPQPVKDKVSPNCLKRPMSFTGGGHMATGNDSEGGVPIAGRKSMSDIGESRTIDETLATAMSPMKKKHNSDLVKTSHQKDFGSDIIDIEETAATHGFIATTFQSRKVTRLMVQGCTAVNRTKILSCTNASRSPVTVTLQNTWADQDVCPGDIIHVIGTPGRNAGDIIVNHANERLLIINPDLLVTCTAIAESLVCERQVVLGKKVRIPGGVSKPMVYGSITHELIQTSLMASKFDLADLEMLLNDIIARFADDLTLADCSAEEARVELTRKLPIIRSWAVANIGGRQTDIPNDRGRMTTRLSLERIVEVEEEIWSPFLGIKGKIDVTVEVSCSDNTALSALEIKTGNGTTSTSHRVQTMLYTLLLAERHPGNTHDLSLLYYCDKGELFAIKSTFAERRSLLQRRNVVARALSLADKEIPPALLTNQRMCEGCSKRAACAVYQSISEDPLPENAGILAYLDEIALEPSHKKWFSHWDHLITLEAMSETQTHPWWTEQYSSQFETLTIKQYKPRRLCVKAPGMWIYELENLTQEQSSLSNGDAIIFSTASYLAVARGTCRSSDDGKRLFVATDSELMMSFKYKVNRDAFPGTATTARNNLVATVTNGGRLRDLVIDLAEPTYAHTQVSVPENFSFNKDQQSAIHRVLNARDFALILGMPGSGKTTTVVSIISMLVEQGKSVLVTGYTNSSVDNIVLQLLKKNVPVLRLGRNRSMHHEVRHAMSENAALNPLEVPVIASTSLGMGHRLFSIRRFDYCIVDEASQITVPVCLGPLLCADKFVLVGDHYQLPPLVQDPSARAGGLGESLFKILCDAHPDTVTALSLQYRMSEDIMALSSELIYDGRLKCGSEKVAKQCLDLLKYSSISSGLDSWLTPVIEPENRVVFLNTDNCGAPCEEVEQPDGIANPGETTLISKTATALIQSGLDPNDLGVISIYRAQLQMLKERFLKTNMSTVEILTVDQSQGRDKDCIIVSLVRSNQKGRTGELLRDWRRINVAFTRAKKKLIIVGSLRTLSSNATKDLAKFIAFCQSRQWVWPAGLATAEIAD